MTNPYIKSNISVRGIMVDVMISLFPLIVVAYLAYGWTALAVISTSITFALLAELLSSWLFLGRKNTLFDGSGIITGLLLAFILSPNTPLHVVAFGAVSAVIFGKVLWGGIGKNRFNPALIGREFMAVFFPLIMNGAALWAKKASVNIPGLHGLSFFASDVMNAFSDSLIYKTSGALGEYSILGIALGGFYLLMRNRISWHIPFSLLVSFALGAWLLQGEVPMKYSVAGILFAAIFMATDMPTSPVTSKGKLFYGAMIGVVSLILIKTGVRYEYMSYSILILNGFAGYVNNIFRPKVWGAQMDWMIRAEDMFLLALSILMVAFAVSALYNYHFIPYLIYIFIVYLVLKFIFVYHKQLSKYI